MYVAYEENTMLLWVKAGGLCPLINDASTTLLTKCLVCSA